LRILTERRQPLLDKTSGESTPIVSDAFRSYFNQIKVFDPRDATEHTLRPSLHNLLSTLAEHKNPKIKVIPEPKRDESGKGAPDVKFKIGESILGYLENKRTEVNLDNVLKSEQITRYKKLSDNLILTNYLEWIWLKNGEVIGRETLAYASDVSNHKARLDPDKAEKVGNLIGNFLSTPPKGIDRVEILALALATRCHDLREFLTEELIRQEKEHQEGRLFGLFNVFKKDVFHELNVAGFADAFAQMLGYGLFLARLNSGQQSLVTLINAKQYIPSNFELIRELVNFLDEMDKPEYSRIKWLIEEILSLMNTLNLASIKENLSFTKGQGRLWTQTEEERLLFAKDPYVYFYEDFLKAYDKDMRKSRGVYYTPPPVVNFIIRAINDILKNIFGIKQGLADRKRVTALDFATGTGTFILEVLHQIYDVTTEGLRDQVIREHALKNLYGFEYLIAPYTIAHLKLSQFLHDKGFIMQPNERLQIYLTNTLEPIDPQPNYLLPALSKEVEHAQKVKEKHILVITGNPPYAGHSKNPSFLIQSIATKKGKTKKLKTLTFIGKLIEDYKKVDGHSLVEKNQKWIHDDYVKFIRFAQWKMDQVNEGVVGIITNHSFLDNPTFSGMRQSLMKTFNQIYILDLHGGNKEKGKNPEGGIDQNVFDILQGVCISIFVRKTDLEQKVFHSDLWGRRADKYRACAETEINKIQWNILQPNSPHYLFIPQNEDLRGEYEKNWKVTDIFVLNGTGVITKRDNLCIKFTEDEVWQTVRSFNTTPPKEAYLKFKLPEDVRDWKVEWAQADIAGSGPNKLSIKPILLLYRPFDTRYTYYTGKARGFLGWPVERIMKHLLPDNVALITSRLTKGETFKHVQATDKIVEVICMSPTTSNNGFVFPLYVYNLPDDKKHKTAMIEQIDPFQGKDRIENFSPAFRTFIDNKYEHHYSPEDIMGYIYATLHSTAYRRKYVDFLKRDFPRISFVDDRERFEKLSKLGWALVQAHLLKDIPSKPNVEVSQNDDPIEKPVYDPEGQRLYANKNLYFAPVPEDVWNFYIGGYQVLDRYLKYRKGRRLSLDEKENIINVVRVLRFTIDQMTEIDRTWKP